MGRLQINIIMISTSDSITFDSSAAFATGQGRQFRSPDIVCIGRLVDLEGSGRHVYETQARDNKGAVMGGGLFEFTTAALNALTGSGADDTAKYFNCVEQAVKAELETLNPSATFTIV